MDSNWQSLVCFPSPQLCARPLKRAIQDQLLDPLATKLLLGEFKPGDRIKVVARDGELEFTKK